MFLCFAGATVRPEEAPHSGALPGWAQPQQDPVPPQACYHGPTGLRTEGLIVHLYWSSLVSFFPKMKQEVGHCSGSLCSSAGTLSHLSCLHGCLGYRHWGTLVRMKIANWQTVPSGQCLSSADVSRWVHLKLSLCRVSRVSGTQRSRYRGPLSTQTYQRRESSFQSGSSTCWPPMR